MFYCSIIDNVLLHKLPIHLKSYNLKIITLYNCQQLLYKLCSDQTSNSSLWKLRDIDSLNTNFKTVCFVPFLNSI